MLTALRPNYAARAYTQNAACKYQSAYVIKLASDEHDEVRAGHSQIKYFKVFFVVDKKHNVKTDIFMAEL
jgi:hypothetical protein